MPQNPNQGKEISRTATAAAVAAALVAGGALVYKAVEYREDHPAEYPGGVEDVQNDLGVNPDSAPVLTPEAPQSGKLPDIAVNGVPEDTVTVQPPNSAV